MTDQELRELLESLGTEGVKLALAELDKVPRVRVKVHTEHGPVKQISSVIKKYECLGCGAKYSTAFTICNKEQLICLDEHGQVHCIRAKVKGGDCIVVPCIVSKCSLCTNTISRMSRDELEKRFYLLLKNSSFKEIASYAKAYKDLEESGSVHAY